jgi:Ca2+-binding EF-hand superfamily protein
MKTLTTTILTSAALATAAPALAQQSDAETDMPDFCETAFMPADQNKDGFMSEQEIKDARDAEFAALDLNKDGSVDREEMTNCIGNAQKEQQAAMDTSQTDGTSRDWSNLDTGGKSEMSVEEWQSMTNKIWKSDDSGMKSAVSEDTDDAERFAKTAVERFQMYDGNGDGVVTQAEYEGEVDKDRSDKALQKRFEAMDADDSGALSPMEYRGAGTRALDMTVGTSESKNMNSGSADASDSSDKSASDAQAASDENTVPVVIYYYSLV